MKPFRDGQERQSGTIRTAPARVGDEVVARQIISVPLNAEDLKTRFKDIDFDFVIANPHLIREGASVAFQNVREHGGVVFSIGLTQFEATINRLREFAFERGMDAVWRPTDASLSDA